jgi:hypothetical protein
MQRTSRWMVVVLIIAGPQLSACAPASAPVASKSEPAKGKSEPAKSKSEPAKVEPIDGTDLSRVSLSAKAAKRLDIQTAPVRDTQVTRKQITGGEGGGTQRTVIPYAAVLYDPDGDTWTYTNPESLVFVRHRISVDYIDRDLAILSDGPPPGTKVVTVGAAELFGTEFEVGH